MAIDVSPRFTFAMRGYAKDEVDDYVDSVNARCAELEDALEHGEARNRHLEHQVSQLSARVSELEGAIREETPHTARALGERITLILEQAELGATETVEQARARADYLLAEAEREAEHLRRQADALHAQANETLAGAQRQAETLVERAEADARSRATAILNDAEGRARRRQEQIEQWVDDEVARTHAEQSRLAEQFAALRRRHELELAELLARRGDAVQTLRTLQDALGRAVEAVPATESPRAIAPAAPQLSPSPAAPLPEPAVDERPVVAAPSEVVADADPEPQPLDEDNSIIDATGEVNLADFGAEFPDETEEEMERRFWSN